MAKRGTSIFITSTPGYLKRRIQNQDRRKRAQRQSLLGIDNLGLSTTLRGKKRRAPSSEAEELQMSASASHSANTAAETLSTIEVERDGRLKVYNDLELNGSGTTPHSESEDGCSLVSTSMPSPNHETQWSISTRSSVRYLNKEPLYSPTNDAEEEYSQVERRQPFRIEIPPPP